MPPPAPEPMMMKSKSLPVVHADWSRNGKSLRHLITSTFVSRIRVTEINRISCKESLRAHDESAKQTRNSMPTCHLKQLIVPNRKCRYAQNNFMDLPKPVVPKTENRKLLKGQKAIVTGASSGIGRSIALALGHAGADVCVNYVAGEDKAQAMVDELRGHGHTAIAFQSRCFE